MLIGATATDKFGYLVGSAMINQNQVSTLVWAGADKVEVDVGDEIPKMIKSQVYGRKADHVIEKAMRTAQAVIFVGGSGLTMKEFYHAMLADKLVIPVALGDAGYASDVIHKSIDINLDSLENFATDPGLAFKQQRRTAVHALLDKRRMDRLRLDKQGAIVVADTIMEILHALRLSHSYSKTFDQRA